jgi:hypothetical protein
MEQYLDQKDGKWHITFWTELPRVIIKNKLNFRIKSITLNDGSVVTDPQINNSKYIFAIHESMLGKKVFFNFSFDINEIFKISEFIFGLCDEKNKWFLDSLLYIKNIKFKHTEDFKINEIYHKENIIEKNIIEENITNNNDIFDYNLDVIDLNESNILTDNFKISENKNIIKSSKNESSLRKSRKKK